MTKFLNISTDNTLGGNSPSDVLIASQKAVKDYVDQHGGGGYHPDLFDHKWADHICNDVQWLRADTFSWQDGSVYEAAYNHLLNDYNSTPLNVEYYAWKSSDNVIVYTDTGTPDTSSSVYDTPGHALSRTAITSYTSTTITVEQHEMVYSGTYTRYSDGDVGTRTAQTETIAGITISYYRANDGHKIVLADQESNVVSIYNATGVAWYYIIDYGFKRFKLPRTKFGFTGIRSGVGGYVEAGLPDHTHQAPYGKNDTENAHNAGTNSPHPATSEKYSTIYGYGLNSTLASASNSIYGNSDTVQPKATEMYLYFYVGAFTQTAIENTAGLNAELFNNKVDLAGSWGFPTTQYDNITVGASGSYYTAPADGWFSIRHSNATLMALVDSSNTEIMISWTGYSGGHGLFMPVAKGGRIRLDYLSGTTAYFRFVYAKKTN